MENKEEKEIARRKKRIKNIFFGWVKDNYDKAFLLVLATAFLAYLFVFFKTLNQPLWYDAANYLATAKRLVFPKLGLNDIWYYRRGFFWALFPALFFALGLGEAGVRLSLVFFGSGIVLTSYLLLSKMFDKKKALISSIGVAFSWIVLFFVGRPLTDIPACFFLLLSLLFFWKGYVLKEGKKFLYLFGVFLAFSFLTRMQTLMFVPAFLIIIFLKEKFKFLLNKDLWIVFFIFLLLMTPHIILYSKHYGNPIKDLTTYYLKIGENPSFEGGSKDEKSFSNLFSYFRDLPYMLGGQFLLGKAIFFLFLFGAFIFFLELFLGFDKIFKSKELQKKIFVFSWIVIPFLALGYITEYIEQRYILSTLPFFFLLASLPLFSLEKYLGKNKKSSIILIAILFLILMIPNIIWANKLIEIKKTSYLQVKEAALWIKENSNPGDIVISNSQPYIVYYGERPTYSFNVRQEGLHYQKKELLNYSWGEKGLDEFVKEKKPKYLMLSIFENHKEWMYEYPQKHNDTLIPVKAWFADSQKKQPIIIIYEFKHV